MNIKRRINGQIFVEYEPDRPTDTKPFWAIIVFLSLILVFLSKGGH